MTAKDESARAESAAPEVGSACQVRKPERLHVRTRDGWRLALYRYPARHRSSRFGPVVLFHGLGANRFNMDAPVPQISLAQYLAARGHDVWVVELRGAGRSRPPGWPLTRRRTFDFDDYVQKDIPAILRRVLDDSGYPQVNWVGHSMGGMLAYASMLQYDQRVFRRVTTIGSPVFTSVRHPVVDLVVRAQGLLSVLDWLPAAPLSMAATVAPRWTLTKVGWVAGNPENLEPAHMRRMASRTLTPLPSALLTQFAGWYTGGFAQTDGLYDYWELLDRIEAPIQIIAGPKDQLCPQDELEAIFEGVGSRHKELLIASEERGFSCDYGHIDLVLGKLAREEIYPHIADWIERGL